MSAYAATQNQIESEDTIRYSPNSEDELEDELEPPLPVNHVREPIKPTFIKNTDNFVYHGNSITVGLKVYEQICISGQYKLVIERGAIVVNNVDYYHAPQEIIILQPGSEAFPIIGSTQVIDTLKVNDIKTPHNQHLFHSDYKSVVRVESFRTGLQDIGKYHPPFKNLLPADDGEYSFEIHCNTVNGIIHTKQVIRFVKELQHTSPCSFMTVGSKNSGKSTLSKLLVNHLVQETPVTVLDIDPGQSEYSKPYCLSLTTHYGPIYGYNYHQDIDDVHYFYGFSTPQHHPELYITIIKKLWEYYSNTLRIKGHHLIVNTPGWVKGYGKQLLVDITRVINPDYLQVLAPSQDNDDLINGLTYNHVTFFEGYFVQPKYSPSDLRTLHRLIYFHKQGELNYNFKDHILDKLPLKVSYHRAEDDTFLGISVVSVLNHDIGTNFDPEDLPLMLDTSLVAYYLVSDEHFQNHKSLYTYTSSFVYLNGSSLKEFVDYNDDVRFQGVCIIHSINTIDHYVNLYFPPSDNVDEIKAMMQQGYRLVLVKGESDIPSSEILHPELIREFRGRMLVAMKHRREVPTFPYVSYNNKVNGVWKVRRNILRRGHHN